MRTWSQRPRRSGRRVGFLAVAVPLAFGVLVFAGGGSASSTTTPVNTAPPSIAGTEREGQALHADPGTWTPAPDSYEYQWVRCLPDGSHCAPVTAVTGSNDYLLGSDDVGRRLYVSVRASNGGDQSAWVNSAMTGVIAASGTAPANTSPPTISGTPQDNQTLTAAPGSWSGSDPKTYTYAWQRCDANGNNCNDTVGTAQSYQVRSTDVGHRLRMVVTATNTAGSSAAASAPTAVVAAAGSAPVNRSLPTIAGTARVGQRLTANAGAWSCTQPITFVYGWQRCDANGNNCGTIAAVTTTATTSLYTVTSADAEHRLRVVMTARNTAGSSAAASAPTAVGAAAGSPPRNTAGASISGAAQRGKTLTANVGSWTGLKPISFLYQWYRCDANGNNCRAIGGAFARRHTLTAADVGHRIRVVVAARNALGSAQVTSAPTPVVAGSGGAPPPGAGAIPVSSVALPNRLVISRVQFRPRVIRSRTRPALARFRVITSGGRPVSGALVYAIGVPANRVSRPSETRTDGNGWATVVFRTLRGLPFKNGARLTIFVRARKPGGSVLGGVSTRRLVSIGVHRG